MDKYYKGFIATLLFCFFYSVHAAEAPKASTEEIKEVLSEEDSYWELDLGLVLNYNRSYINGINDNEDGDFGASIVISGGYYYKDFFIETHPFTGRPLTLGYSLQRTKNFVVNIIAESVFLGFDESSQNHGDSLTGINKRNTSLDSGIEAYYSHKYGETRLRLLHDISNTHNGFVIALDYAYPLFFNKWIVWPSYGISWLSDDSTDYYFGIDKNEVRPDRPEYTPSSAITHKLNIYAAYQHNTHLSFLVYGGYSIFSNNINDSPLVRPNNDSLQLGMGVMWSF